MDTYRAIEIRRNAAVILEHAIARIGYWASDGWPNCDNDTLKAGQLMQHVKWGIEAMDSPAVNRFWTQKRLEYEAMLVSEGIV